MATNFGTITYGTSLFAGSSANIQGTLGVHGNTALSSMLTVAGFSTFKTTATYNAPSTFSTGIVISNVTNATNSNTGSLQVKGGLGVSLSTYLGGILNVIGSATLNSTLAVSGTYMFSSPVTITDTTQSTVYNNGVLTVPGGIGVGGNIRSGIGAIFLAEYLILNSNPTNGLTSLNSPTNDLYINQNGLHNVYVNSSSTSNFNVSGSINVNTVGFQVLTTGDSTSVGSGSLTVAGGASVGLTLNVGCSINSPITQTLTIGSAIFKNTAQSTSSATGSIQTAGGVGIAKNAFVGGYLDVASPAGNDKQLDPLEIFTSRLSSIHHDQTINATDVTIDRTTASTSSSTGAMVVSGGVRIAGVLNVLGASNFTGTSNFSSNVWMNDNNLFLGNSNDQSSGLVYSATSSTGGPLLFGQNGGALGTTTGSQLVALTWDSTQSVQILGTTDTASSSTGTFTVGEELALLNLFGLDPVCLFKMVPGQALGTITPGSTSGEFKTNATDFNFCTNNHTSPNIIAPYVTFNVNKGTGHVTFFQTDDSTGASTGSFQVYSGSSIAKSLFVGSNTTLGVNLVVSGTISTTGSNPVTFSNIEQSTSTSTGSVVISGGTGIASDLYVGALVVGGGVGIGGDINIAGNETLGGNLTVQGKITSTAGSVNLTNTTQSTSTSTGAVILGGGIGIGGDVYTGGIGVFTNTAATVSVSSGSIVTNSGDGIAGGSLFISGGVGIAKSLSVGSPINSTGLSSGGLVVSAGAGIAGNVFIGGNQTLSGTSPLFTFVNNGLAPPSFSTRSIGTKVLYNSLSVSTVDYAIEMDTNDLWYSIPANASSNSFKWYGANLVAMALDGLGNLSINSTTETTSTSSRSLQVLGGVGVAKSLFVGSHLSISGTSWFTGGVMANSNVMVGGIVLISSNTDSTSLGVGSLVTSGGLSVALTTNLARNFNVLGSCAALAMLQRNCLAKTVMVAGSVIIGGSTTITGNLVVNGTRTQIDTVVSTITHNVISAGSTATTVVLDSGASSIDSSYNGAWFLITPGTGATQTNLMPSPVEGLNFTTILDTTSTYSLFTGQYIVTVYDEIADEYAIGSTLVNPATESYVPIRNRIKVHAGTVSLNINLYVNSINNYTAGNGTNVESVLIKAGVVTGVVTLNGNAVDVTGTVQLIDNNNTQVAVLPETTTYSAYRVLVTDVNSSGTSACFDICGNTSCGGSLIRSVSSLGSMGEHVTIIWSRNGYPSLKYLNLPSEQNGFITILCKGYHSFETSHKQH
ncbi:hypothetical protein BDK51DRAFT_32478 [Blyttiomyces helicus]|uniref:Uncharacterized protein n=1 Tax=Blyttiomyces helicus TaxID=388810 RepID=A0A4P9WPU9_9FUNG|nr:hypothetical protein BDK51DRAFT_32478 [Blyttiomyces helicus]|eukprot:RKO93290.1 hypothetical protein BDK51DRAFT_32478 [Blyttiomyces helicus]